MDYNDQALFQHPGSGNGGKRLNKGRQAKSNENFIGVPPDLTESSKQVAQDADFDDEDAETDAHNNFLTQADLFKSYTEQNNLYCNLSNKAMWFEFGGRNIGNMSLDIAALHNKHQQ